MPVDPVPSALRARNDGKRNRKIRVVPGLMVLSCWALPASASDFSVITYLFVFLSVIASLAIGAVVYQFSRLSRHILYRSVLWGVFAALVLTPVSPPDSDGYATPVFLLLANLIGGAPDDYRTTAFETLLVSIPVCVLVIALVLWGSPSSAEQDVDPPSE